MAKPPPPIRATQLIDAAIAMSTPGRFVTDDQADLLASIVGNGDEKTRELVFELSYRITVLMHMACCIQIREGSIISDYEVDGVLGQVTA
jgi:hypothetical protein